MCYCDIYAQTYMKWKLTIKDHMSFKHILLSLLLYKELTKFVVAYGVVFVNFAYKWKIGVKISYLKERECWENST